MKTTLAIDDDLLKKAQDLTGLTEQSVLVHEGLIALIERENARRRMPSEAVPGRPDIWSLILAEPETRSSRPYRSREDIDAALAAERDGWDRG